MRDRVREGKTHKGAKGSPVAGPSGWALALLFGFASCLVPPPPPVAVRYHPDGTATTWVAVSQVESEVEAKQRLLAGIACATYEIVQVSPAAARVVPPATHWIRYRCEGRG